MPMPMPAQLLFLLTLFMPLLHLSKADEPWPRFAFAWMDEKDEFRAGDIATIRVIILGNYRYGHYRHAFNPNISVNYKMGNSTFITGLHSNLGPDMIWRIFFMPIMVGLHNVLITDDYFNVFDSSMHFHVTPGQIYSPGGIVSMMDQVNNLVAGTKATVLILPKDAFGNNVTLVNEGRNIEDYVLYTTNEHGSNANLLTVSNIGWDGFGYLRMEFIAVTAGNSLVHIKQKNDTLYGSPLPLIVHPGALDVGNCLATWITETKAFQLFSTMETFIQQRDKYGNLVPGHCAFDLDVMEKGTNLSLPIGDLLYKDIGQGIQSISFKLVEPGDFILMISDMDTKKQISNTPYEFSIYIGYFDGFQSIVNGSGFDISGPGKVSKFSIFLRDAYEYPSPLELEWIKVKIILPERSLRVYPRIYPMDSVNDWTGTQSTGMLTYGPAGIASVPSVYSYNNSAANWKTRSSAFDVFFLTEKSGVYEITIFCGNIPLQGGRTFRKAVLAGEVNMSMSGVVQYPPTVRELIVNDLLVQLVDSFSNPVLGQESYLNLLIASINKSAYTDFVWKYNRNGTYTGSFLLMEVGAYELCVAFYGWRFLPCPFGVTAHSSHYFPRAFDDTVSVWEDESISFSVTENDYFAGGNATFVGYQKASHGSVLQYGSVLRYTPYKGFYGNDSFMYTMSDANGNTASAAVNISVLCTPPQFVSFPTQLQANEDILSPKFGGFPSLEIAYSDSLENISVMLSAQHGTVLLSPLLMQLWDPMWNQLSVTKMEGRPQDLKLAGRLEVINLALHSLQYIGDENFSGTDAIRISTINKYGKNDLDIPIFVQPINDPPFINVPEFIILENEREDEGFIIFDRQRDKFDFSIGDPDHRHFPGNESHFRVMFSVEVSSGFLSANLPAGLIRTTEVKLKSSKQWQPLQTFVEISGYFTVKAKGIRFRGTINDCNSLLQQLLYYGDKHGGVLRVKVNDMGWYGCYPDCTEMMSVPLIAEATIILITRAPVNSLVAHSLGSVIVIELIVLSSLAVILMFFTCKCVIVLVREKKKRQAQSQNYKLQSSNGQTTYVQSSTDSSENMINLTGNSPTAITQTGQPSNPLHQESGL